MGKRNPKKWMHILISLHKFRRLGDHNGVLRCHLMSSAFSQLIDLEKLWEVSNA